MDSGLTASPRPGMTEDVDGRDFRREDGAEFIIGPRYARNRWRLLPGHDKKISASPAA